MKKYTLEQFIEMLDIHTIEEGRALWELLANRDVFVDGVEVLSGSFRYNGCVISKYCGGDYMTYYCSSGMIQETDKLMEKFMDLNVSTREVQC